MHFILFPTLQYSRSPTWQVLLEPILSMEFRDADYRSWKSLARDIEMILRPKNFLNLKCGVDSLLASHNHFLGKAILIQNLPP